MRLIAALLVIVIAAPAASSDWAEVQRLQPGVQLRVMTTDGRSLTGKLVGTTADTIEVENASAVERGSLARVEQLRRSRRANWAIIGAGIGFASGGAAGALICLTCLGEGGEGQYLAHILVLGMVGAGVGALLGYMKSPWVTVYRAPRRR